MSLFSALFGEHKPKTDPYYKTDIGYLRTSEFRQNMEFFDYFSKLTVTNIKNVHVVLNLLSESKLINFGCEHCCREGTFVDEDFVWQIRDKVRELKDCLSSDEHESIYAFAKVTNEGKFDGINVAKWLRLTMFFLNHSIKRMGKIPAKYHVFFRHLENRYTICEMDRLAYVLKQCETEVKNIDKTLKAYSEADNSRAIDAVIGDYHPRKDNDFINTTEEILKDIYRYKMLFNPNESIADIYRALLEYSRGYYYK